MGLSGGRLGMERAGLEVTVEREHGWGCKVASLADIIHLIDDRRAQ